MGVSATRKQVWFVTLNNKLEMLNIEPSFADQISNIRQGHKVQQDCIPDVKQINAGWRVWVRAGTTEEAIELAREALKGPMQGRARRE